MRDVRWKMVWWIALLIGTVLESRAQSFSPEFELLSTGEGLLDNSPMALLQDRRGYLWIGGQTALQRFDGRNITGIRAGPNGKGLSDNFVYSLYEDRRGFIWIGTRSGGATRYDPIDGTTVQYVSRPDDPGSLSHGRVRAFVEDESGTIWVGTSAGGLNRIDGRTGQVTRPNSRLSHAGKEILALSKWPGHPGTILVGSDSGLIGIDVQTEKITRLFPSGGKHVPVVTALLVSRQKRDVIWIGTRDNGFYEFHTTSRGVRHLDSLDVSSILEWLDGKVWIGTRRNGLFLLDPDSWTTQHFASDPGRPKSLANDLVLSLLMDRTDNLWVGVSGGLNHFRPIRSRVFAYRPAPGESSSLTAGARSITSDRQGYIWVGTNGRGFNRIDRRTGDVRAYYDAPGTRFSIIQSMVIDRTGKFWVVPATDQVYLFDKRTGRLHTRGIETLNQQIPGGGILGKIYESPSRPGYVWITTNHAGLFGFDSRTGKVTNYRHDPRDPTSLSGDFVWDVFEDQAGRLWVATLDDGLNWVDPRTGRFTHLRNDPQDPATISSNRPVEIKEDRQGNIWVGTFGEGLNRIDTRTGKVTRYTTVDGLPNNSVGSIEVADDGTLWLGTAHGISHFDPRTGRFTNFTTADGLHGNYFYFNSSYKDETGTLYFGGIDGLSVFHPRDLHSNPHIPPVVVTNFRVQNQLVRLDSLLRHRGEVVLPYNRNSISVEFAALSYDNPEDNEYAYRLDGVDRDWVYAGTDNHVSYGNLLPGTYTFRVKGSNNDGVWNEKGTAFRIVIRPPFWDTVWFKLIVFATVMSLLGVALAWKLHSMRELERTRRRIADDLHDDIAGKISSIALMAEMAGRMLPEEREREGLFDIASLARTTANDLRDAVWVVDAGNDRLEALVDRMRLASGQLLTGLHHDFLIPDPLPDLRIRMEDRRHLFFLYKEILHNIARHAHASSVVTEMKVIEGSLTIRVTDDGCGFDPERIRSGRGMQTLQRRAVAIRGQLEIESRPGEGTSILLEARLKGNEHNHR